MAAFFVDSEITFCGIPPGCTDWKDLGITVGLPGGVPRVCKAPFAVA